MDHAEAISELERVALLLEATAAAIEIEAPGRGSAVARLRSAASELSAGVEELRVVWEVPK